jgi:NAD(P)-dependent dehydrogenase (short-subunit alcohol dehydrogenase family)
VDSNPKNEGKGWRSVKSVLVTGAAGGLGSATVDAFLDNGFHVIGVDRIATAERKRYSPVVADLTNSEETRAALSNVSPFNHVVSIAGGALAHEKMSGDVDELPLSVFRESIDQNLTSAFITLQAALRHLRAAEGDRSVTLTTSTDALMSYGLPAYAAAKAGVIGLVRSLAGPLGAEGIRINAVAPGDIPTPRNQREWAHKTDRYERIAAGSALRRLCTPEEIAQTFLSVATQLTGMTGQTLIVDAGLEVMHPEVLPDR